MKKKNLLLFLLLIVLFPINVKALSVDKNNLTLEKGKNETIGLYAEVDSEITEIQFTLVYTTYDVPAYFNIEAGLTDTNPNGITHRIKFPEPISGKIKLGNVVVSVVNNPKVSIGTVNIHSGKATTTSGQTINLDIQTINVNITKPEIQEEKPVEIPEETSEKNTNLLDKIESELVKIDIKENVYEYKVNIKNDIEELDLKPIAKQEKYKVEISSQKISELKDNQIIITVKDGDNTEEYKITVNILKEHEEIEIDEEEFVSTYKYKGKWITTIILLSVVLFVGLALTKRK